MNQKENYRQNFLAPSSFHGKKISQGTSKKYFKKFFPKKETKWFAQFGPGGGFFGVGTSELVVIGAVAWLVLGPKRLYQLARDIGKISGEIKNVAEEAKQTFQQAIDIEGLDSESQMNNKKTIGQENIAMPVNKSKKKKVMKSLDDMVKTDISKNEINKD